MFILKLLERKMSSLVSFINSIDNNSFENIKRTFEDLGCRVSDNVSSYMIYSPLDSSSNHPILEHCVGSIFSKETNRLLCYGFPKTFDYTNDIEWKNGNIVASEYIDGSLLRAYWDGSVWRLSTNGSINAYESYWISEKSFGELFDDCLSRIYKTTTTFSRSALIEKLDKNCCYQFLIKHPSVHIDQTTKPFIYHVATFDLTTLCYVEKTALNTIRKPKTFEFDSIEKMKSSLGDMKGFVFYPMDSVDTQSHRYKILSERFVYLRTLLGNTPNLYYRYLECKHQGISNELIANFPSIKYYSSWVEKSLFEIIRNSYNLYVERYIKRQPDMFINFFYRPVIRDLHKKYLETKQKITIPIVSNLVHGYHPKRLLFILNGLKYLNTSEVYDPTLFVKDHKEEVEVSVQKEDIRQTYGNRFYPIIESIVGPEFAPKVCGMILETDEETLERLSKDSSELDKLTREALQALQS
jgi:hypothetical protein